METILGGIVIALVAGIAGKAASDKNAVKCHECDVKQKACQSLLIEKINNVNKNLEKLTEAVNGKLFGL